MPRNYYVVNKNRFPFQGGIPPGDFTKFLAGSITPTSALTKILGGPPPPQNFTKNVAGQVVPFGTLTRTLTSVPPSQIYPNRPNTSGWAELAHHKCNNGNLDTGESSGDFDLSFGSFTFPVTNPPLNGPSVFQFAWTGNIGQAPVHWDFSTDYTIPLNQRPRFRRAYTSCIFRLVSNPTINDGKIAVQSVGNKLWYMSYGNTENNNQSTIILRGNGSGGDRRSAMAISVFMSTAGQDQCAGSVRYNQNITSSALVLVGQYMQIEWLIELEGTPVAGTNCSGSGYPVNGRIRTWIRNLTAGTPAVLVLDRNNIKMLDTRISNGQPFTQGVRGGEFTPVFGGSGGTQAPQGDRMQIVDFYWAGSNT